MIEVALDKGKFKIPVEKALKILKKKLLKEQTIREMKDREFYVSPGRKRYLERSHRKYVARQELLSED